MARSKNAFTVSAPKAFTRESLAAYNKENGTNLRPGDKDPRPGRENKRIRRFRDILTPAQKEQKMMQRAQEAAAKAADTKVTALLSRNKVIASISQAAAQAAQNDAEASMLLDDVRYNARVAKLQNKIRDLEVARENAADVRENIRSGLGGLFKVRSTLAARIGMAVLTNTDVNISDAEVDTLVRENVTPDNIAFLRDYDDAFPTLHGGEDDSDETDSE